jgi:hypothetical protein
MMVENGHQQTGGVKEVRTGIGDLRQGLASAGYRNLTGQAQAILDILIKSGPFR